MTYRERLEGAIRHLSDAAGEEGSIYSNYDEAKRLAAKAEGAELALSFYDEEIVMGSDMAMEKHFTRTYGVWEMKDDEQVFRIYTVNTYAYVPMQIWEGNAKSVDNSQDLIKLILGSDIPIRPEPKLSNLRKIIDYLDYRYGTEYENNDDDAAEILSILNLQ